MLEQGRGNGGDSLFHQVIVVHRQCLQRSIGLQGVSKGTETFITDPVVLEIQSRKLDVAVWDNIADIRYMTVPQVSSSKLHILYQLTLRAAGLVQPSFARQLFRYQRPWNRFPRYLNNPMAWEKQVGEQRQHWFHSGEEWLSDLGAFLAIATWM